MVAARRLTLLTVACCLDLAGSACKSSSSEQNAPPPPSGFSVRADSLDFDAYYLAWTPPSIAVDAFELQGRLGSGAWEGLGSQIPSRAIGAVIQLDPSVPELTTLAFRIRSVRGAVGGDWSNEASISRGIRWPVEIASHATQQGMVLEWRNGSRVATGVRVSRSIAGQWQALAHLPATAATYLDTAPMIVDEPIGYRITAVTGSEESQEGHHTSPGFPPTPVWNLTATTELSGVRLRWSSPPIADQAFAVCRCGLGSGICCSGATPHPLPSQTTEYLDPAPPGAYRYEVSSRYSNPASLSPSAFTEAVTNPVGTPQLVARLIRLPASASGVARDSQGRYGTTHGGMHSPPYTDQMTVRFTGSGAPPDHDFGIGYGIIQPFLIFDDRDHPHVMLLAPVSGDPATALIHAWYDGASWQTEEVVRRSFYDPMTAHFARDQAGILYAAWSLAENGAAEFARRDAGGWTTEDLAPYIGPVGLPALVEGLAVDGTGVPAVLLCGPGDCAVLRRDATWSLEGLPAGIGSTLGATHGGLGVLQGRCVGDYASPHGQIVLLERDIAAWSPEQLIEEFTQCLPVDFKGIADSPDGSRRVLWTGPISRLDLRFRQDAGPWTTVDTGLSDLPFVWFDSWNRVEILVRASHYPGADGKEPYAVFSEP
jgi:hypothetical protein